MFKKITKLTLLTLIIAAAIWFFRPLFHWLFFSLGYASPQLPEAAAIGAAILIVTKAAVSRLPMKKRTRYGDSIYLIVLALVAAIFFTILVLGGVYPQVHVSQTLDVNEIDSVAEVNPDRPRILPMSVAEQYASNSLQYPRYQITAGDVSIVNGTPYWSYVLAPDGFINYFRLKGRGAILVDMTTEDKKTKIEEDRLTVAPGQGILDNIGWRLLKERYWVNYEDPIAIPHDGEVYIAVPYIEYSHHFRPPSIYAVPRWGGIALVSPDGSIEYLSPEEAAKNEVLKGHRLYPFDLSRYYVNSFRYQHGIVNKWFYHRDELEVASVPGEGNDQPFTVMTEDGTKYFVAVEPYGNAQGIYQIWTFDARTGNVERYTIPVENALMGPNKAAQYVRKENPVVDWDRMSPSEPLPTVVNETFYWQVRIVPNDSSGVSYTAFVNAETSEVHEFEDDTGVKRFLRSTPLPTSKTTGEVTVGNRSVMTILIKENGTVVDRVEISQGQKIEIRGRD